MSGEPARLTVTKTDGTDYSLIIVDKQTPAVTAPAAPVVATLPSSPQPTVTSAPVAPTTPTPAQTPPASAPAAQAPVASPPARPTPEALNNEQEKNNDIWYAAENAAKDYAREK